MTTAPGAERVGRLLVAATQCAWLLGGGLIDRWVAGWDLGRRASIATAHRLVRSVATSPVINWIVDAQLDRTVGPLIAPVVDEVLAILSAEPERVGALVRDQRESLTDELLDRIRDGAAAGDAVVDRLTARLLRRREPAAPPVLVVGLTTGALVVVEVVGVALGAQATALARRLAPVLLLAPPALLIGYCAAFWALVGRTPGAALLGLRVVRPDGGAVPWWPALVRALVLVLLPILALWCLVDARHQGGHDKLARTVVRYSRASIASASRSRST